MGLLIKQAGPTAAQIGRASAPLWKAVQRQSLSPRGNPLQAGKQLLQHIQDLWRAPSQSATPQAPKAPASGPPQTTGESPRVPAPGPLQTAGGSPKAPATGPPQTAGKPTARPPLRPPWIASVPSWLMQPAGWVGAAGRLLPDEPPPAGTAANNGWLLPAFQAATDGAALASRFPALARVVPMAGPYAAPLAGFNTAVAAAGELQDLAGPAGSPGLQRLLGQDRQFGFTQPRHEFLQSVLPQQAGLLPAYVNAARQPLRTSGELLWQVPGTAQDLLYRLPRELWRSRQLSP